MSQKFLAPQKNIEKPQSLETLVFQKAKSSGDVLPICGFPEVEGGILGLLQLPAGQAAVCQLAKTAEEVNFGEAGLWMKKSQDET